ncbi:LysR family transcriptional regulator [Streptomyces sp. NPDC058572]|uniref:LysR family transcriptional regulator n=1 Tax=Streptomyces sp. NPDC058572 TaxID=3346546 RepID=UPI003646CFC2
MDVTALRSFSEVCRRGSISSAAQALGYTQSALSRQIASLETYLRSSLLHRHARGVRPTPAGAALLEHATAILAQFDRAEQEVTAVARYGTAAARIRVGAVPSASAALLPEALSAFAAERPAVRVEFTEDVSPRLLPGLLDGELDVAVLTDYPPGLPAREGLHSTHLLDDELLCALPRSHRLANPDPDAGDLDLAELADESWVEDYAGSASVLAAACARAGFTPRIDIQCGGWLGKQAFVAAGLGVLLAPALLLPALRPDLAVRRLREPPYRSVYAVVQERHSAPSEASAAFVEALARTDTVRACPPAASTANQGTQATLLHRGHGDEGQELRG